MLDLTFGFLFAVNEKAACTARGELAGFIMISSMANE